MLLTLALLLAPGEVVLAGLGTGTNYLVNNQDNVLVFTVGQSNYAINNIRLFGDNNATQSSITFRLKDSQGANLAFGGAFLNVQLDQAGVDFDLSQSAVGSYALTLGQQYQMSMYVSGPLIMAQATGVAYQPTGWTQDASPGFKYSMDAAAVPEPGNLLMGGVAALFGLVVWWFRLGGSRRYPNPKMVVG